MDSVLIVDDSSFIVEGLIAFLKKKYRPLAAYGGAECLEILKRESPSVIILDIMMEPMDGWETLAHIKENPKTRYIPVLMFSAKKISPEEAEEHRMSIDDFLTKPVSPNKIIEAIEKVLTRRDTNRVVVERWQSAGISQDKIDKYLSLVTSLEVDLSLCQNMRIQYDLVHPSDKNQEEFHAVIKAIEERILQERDLIETLAHEMNDTLVQAIDNGESAGAGGLSITDETAHRYEAASSRSDNPPPLSLEGKLPETLAAAGTAAGVLENSRNTGPAPADTPTISNPPRPPAVPGFPEQDTSPADPGPEVPVSELPPGDLPFSPTPARAETPQPDVAVIEAVPSVPLPGEPGSESPGRDTWQDDSVRETKPEPAPLPLTSPILPAHDPPVTETRKVIPADLDIPPAGSGTASPTGAGTDVPMPWDSPRERKPQKKIPSEAEKHESLNTGTASPSSGVFARIISLVRSFFGKPK
jgi:CheY-like chemotaxis protein